MSDLRLIYERPLDERALAEIRHCLWYARYAAHGTVGHNLLMLSAQLAWAQGFRISPDGTILYRLTSVPSSLKYPKAAVLEVATLEEYEGG